MIGEVCWKRCDRPVTAIPIFHGEEVTTCRRHHPYRRRLFFIRQWNTLLWYAYKRRWLRQGRLR